MPLEPRSHRVLVVDDDVRFRDSVVGALAESGFDCEVASDGVEALGWAMAAPFDLIVTDLRMPRLDGVGLIRRLKELTQTCSVRVIAISDTGDDPDAQARADAILRKPLTAERIVAEAKKLIAAPLAEEKLAASELKGSFDFFKPAELCKILHLARRSGRLEVTSAQDELRGVIHFRDGEIASARVESRGEVVAQGEPAVARIFSWTAGQFALDPGKSGGEWNRRSQRIGRPTPRVLAEASTSSRVPAAAPAARLGPFELLETLSEGANATVHRARREEPGSAGRPVRLVVEKRRPAESRDLEALRRLDVPGIARLLAWGDLADGRVWYESAMPRGPTLEETIREKGPLPLERAVVLLDGILEALGRAHSRALAHGGLDARRVVLPPGGQPVLIDHGLTPRGGPSDQAAVAATPPEAWRGKKPDARSDMYRVGVLLFFALSGRYPFPEEDPLRVCHDHLRTPAPTLAAAGLTGASDDLEALVRRLLAKDPGARPGHAEEARSELERIHARLRASGAVQPADMPPPPIGYRFIRKLGTGGAGEVYEAFHETLEKIVAVKVIAGERTSAPGVRERFLREARLAASLDHPGIVRVHDAREEGGRLYLIMQYVEGESLRARVAREGALEEAEVLAYARAILDALAAAHGRGIIHRDIKPDNILLASDGQARIADFGLARSLSAPGDITQKGTLLGSPYYMPPEQCLDKPVDERSDLYALGATLYHLLAGRPPYDGDTPLAILKKHVDGKLTPLVEAAPRVSVATATVVERLLAKDPEKRFRTAGEVLAALSVAGP